MRFIERGQKNNLRLADDIHARLCRMRENNSELQRFEPVLTTKCCLVEKAIFPHKMCEEQFSSSSAALNCFPSSYKVSHVYHLPSANYFFGHVQ